MQTQHFCLQLCVANSIYEGCSKSSYLYLIAVWEYAMHHSKALTLTFIMMLIFSCCTVSFNNYSTLYMAYLIPLACFHVIELCIIIFESESFKPGIIQTTKENCIVFLLFVTYNVHPNVRKATKCVDLI